MRHEEHRRNTGAGTLASADGPASAAVLRLHQREHGCGRGRGRSALPRGDPTWSCLRLWAPCFLQGLCGETGPGHHTHEDSTGWKEQGPFLPQEGGEGQRGEQSSNAERPQFEGPAGQTSPGQGSAWNYWSKEALCHCLIRKRSSHTGQHRTAGSAPISATPVATDGPTPAQTQLPLLPGGQEPTPGPTLTRPSCACGRSAAKGSARSSSWPGTGRARRLPASPRSGPASRTGRAPWSSSRSTRHRSRCCWLGRDRLQVTRATRGRVLTCGLTAPKAGPGSAWCFSRAGLTHSSPINPSKHLHRTVWKSEPTELTS